MCMHEHTWLRVVVRRKPSGVIFCHSLPILFKQSLSLTSLYYDLRDGYHKVTPCDRPHVGGFLERGAQRLPLGMGRGKKTVKRRDTGLS